MLSIRSFFKSPVGKRISTVLKGITVLAYCLIFLFLLFLIMATGFDKRLLIDTAYMNMVSLYVIALSAPGMFVNFVEDVLPLEPKKFYGKVTCAECNKVIEIELEEISN